MRVWGAFEYIKLHFCTKSGGKIEIFTVFMPNTLYKPIYIAHFHEVIMIACETIIYHWKDAVAWVFSIHLSKSDCIFWTKSRGQICLERRGRYSGFFCVTLAEKTTRIANSYGMPMECLREYHFATKNTTMCIFVEHI